MPERFAYLRRVLLFAVFMCGAVLAHAQGHAQAQPAAPGLGKPLPADELRPYDITIHPDGRNLPPGRGSVVQGRTLYQTQCAMCHGAKGIEGPAARLAGSDGFFSLSDPLRPLRILKQPLLVLSVGGQWPYATTIFDYIRRAMPHYAPKSLSDDEVYAVTAYVLHLNDLVDERAEMDAAAVGRMAMPALKRDAPAWTTR